MRTVSFIPTKAMPNEWAAYHQYRRARAIERRPDARVQDDDRARLALTRPDPSKFVEHFAIHDQGEIAGFFSLEVLSPASPEYPTGGQIGRISGGVLEPFRCQGIATAFLPTALRFLDTHRATILQAETVEEDGKAFLASAGFECRAIQTKSRLDLRTVDWELVRSWRLAGEQASPAVRAEVFSPRVPPSLRAEVSSVFTMLVNDVPFDDLEHGKIIMTEDSINKWYVELDAANTGHATCVLRDADGTIAAMTDVMYELDSPTSVGQRLTAVRRDRRGRGMAKWVKAVMLEHIRDQLPTAVTIGTENSSTNARMLAVNRQIGFEVVGEKAFFQISREDLRAGIVNPGL